MAENSFAGKVALVTGGSRGIGKAVSKMLAGLGADVIVNYGRSEKDAIAVVEEIASEEGKALAMQADLSDPEEIYGLFQQVESECGGLDILVNCAARGLERPRAALASLPNHLRRTFDTNVLGPWMAAKEAARLMEPRGGGVLINLTSLGAQRFMPNYAAVGVSKGALDTLTRYLAVELAPKKIRVNAVCPGWVDETGGVSALPQKFGEALRQQIPLGRHVTSEDVANVVVFLCSPQSEMIVGQSIILDGGVTLVGPVDTNAMEDLRHTRRRRRPRD